MEQQQLGTTTTKLLIRHSRAWRTKVSCQKAADFANIVGHLETAAPPTSLCIPPLLLSHWLTPSNDYNQVQASSAVMDYLNN